MLKAVRAWRNSAAVLSVSLVFGVISGGGAFAGGGKKASCMTRFARNFTTCLWNKDNFDSKRVHLVDVVGQNVLIRMPNPAIDGEFAEQEFFEAIQKAMPEPLRGSFSEGKIISFSLLNRVFEREEHVVEKNWFAEHPHHEFRYRPQLGSVIPCVETPVLLRNMMLGGSRHLFLPLEPVVDEIRDEMVNQSGVPKIIIIHCVSGRDRAGMVSGVYRMKYGEKSYAEVVQENHEIAGRSQDYYTRNAMHWSALQMAGTRNVGSEQQVLDQNDIYRKPVEAQGMQPVLTNPTYKLPASLTGLR